MYIGSSDIAKVGIGKTTEQQILSNACVQALLNIFILPPLQLKKIDIL